MPSIGERLLVLSVLAAISACGESSEPPLVAEEILQLNTEASQVAFGLDHYMTEEGVRRARVQADTAFYIEDRTLIELHGMEVWFYDQDGRVTSILTSREGTYDWNTGDMTAEGDVVVLNPEEGRRIETSIMHYDRMDDRIWGDEFTRIIEQDGSVVEGAAFETDSRMDEVDLTSMRVVRPSGERSPRR